MNGRVGKTKVERKNKQRRKRFLKKKRKLFNKSLCNDITALSSLKTESNNSIIDWKAVNMAANYWSQSRTKMLEWQHKHEIAYWKSKAEALSYENKILHSVVQNIYCSKAQHSERNRALRNIRENVSQNDNENEEEEMQISEEYLSYLKSNMEHKMELEKSKKEKEEISVPKQPVDRMKEIKLLYGKSSPLIVGLETKVNLNYDLYKDKFKPDYWPYFPLNPWSN